MKIAVKRYVSELNIDEIREYKIDKEVTTLLEALEYIKQTQDSTLAFESGCRSGVCGSCALRVNDKEVLSCSYNVKDEDSITPLKNVLVIRDLVVDMTKAYSFNKKAKAWLSLVEDSVALNEEDEKLNELQSDCILCGSCFSACPVYSVNEDFLGPFSLTRFLKYAVDKREKNPQFDAIVNNGIWDCTLCNECSMVCPQGISSKLDIEKLRSLAAMAGYSDPNFMNNFGSFGLEF